MVASDVLFCGRVMKASSSYIETKQNERSSLFSRPEEEVYPLPWFRSPEWTRHPPPIAQNVRRQREAGKAFNMCSLAQICCYTVSSSDVGSESEMELGYLVRRPGNASEADYEANSLKRCIQFLVGLFLIMAMALVLLIILGPSATR